MFTKYLNQFGKAEAEWVQEILDQHDGNEPLAKAEVLKTIDIIIDKTKRRAQLNDYEKIIDACCFANNMWWPVGLAKLKELGRV